MFNKNLYQKYFFNALLGLFIINLIISVLMYFFLIQKGEKEIFEGYKDSALINFSETKSYINTNISHIKDILNAIDNVDGFNIYLDNGNRNTEHAKYIFKLLLNSNSNLFQFRYIDKSGKELLRVDKDNNMNIIESTNLQDKSSRYYFKKTMQLKENEFYISNLDLNVEHEKIEKPYRPTIRVSKPVYRNNELLGMLIVNYNAKDIINHIQIKSDFDVYYMDDKDNFFLHSDESKNYSTQLGNNYKVIDEIPNINKLVNNTKVSDKYYVTKIDLTDNPFYIIYSIKQNIYENMYDSVQNGVLPVFIIVFLISIPLIIFVLNRQVTQTTILESIINNIPFPIFLKDIHGKILVANDSLAQLSKFKSTQDIVGKKIEQIMEKYKAEKFNIDLKQLEDKDVLVNEIEIYTKNGKQYYYDMKIIKIHILGFIKKVYILGIAVDITSLKSTNLMLQELVDNEVKSKMELERNLMQQYKMAEMGNMLDNILHQWKQPLNMISLFNSEMSFYIDNNIQKPAITKKNVKAISEQIDFMNQTSNDFRSFFSVDKVKEKFQLADSIEKIYRILYHRTKNSNTSITLDLQKNIQIYGYENELGQVILSILNNAFDKFEDDKTNNNIIEVSTIENNDNVIIKISDNGSLISEELLENQLFKRNFTTKEDGSGLGLSICKKIIEDNFNGVIKAYNENNKVYFEIVLSKNTLTQSI